MTTLKSLSLCFSCIIVGLGFLSAATCSLIAKLSSLPLSLSIVSSSSSSSKDGKPNSKSVKLREEWRQRSRPIPPGGTYPAKDHCSRCGLCDTYYIAHFKEACAFLGDGMSKIEVLVPLLNFHTFIEFLLLNTDLEHSKCSSSLISCTKHRMWTFEVLI
ncbi:7-hydroxymethyl chlorophyll a reductase, chloroplastic-like [Prunus dulcis]|uniref:7-hydroxymethyl chlorophyll a reductase, chloroplastic-like n=1 Tax=Prunus dulcis TaxID=3755 RepID=UPI0014824C32|nr:7-hydroxymethyl chlorophyll a reductase, chloroplastic-like [Prunus dulcis]